MLDLLSAQKVYGSHARAVAAGWRWHAKPNLRCMSHNHQWWPPRRLVKEYEEKHGVRLQLPLGTYKVTELIEELF